MGRRVRVLATAVAGCLLVLGGLLAMMTPGGGTQRVEAHFANVLGLVNRSTVLYKGVRVGEISRIDPLGRTGNRAKLTVTFEQGSEIDLRKDAAVALRLKTVLGELYLDLDPGKSSEPLEGPITRTHTDISLDRLIYSGADMITDLQDSDAVQVMIVQSRELIETSGGDVTAVAANTKTLADGLADRSDEIGRIIANLDQITAASEGRSDALGAALAQAAAALADVRNLLVRNRARIDQLVRTVRKVVDASDLAEVDAQLAQAPRYLDQIYSGIRTVNAVLNHDVPALGILPGLPTSAAQDFYAEVEKWGKNPVMRKILIAVLQSYLGHK